MSLLLLTRPIVAGAPAAPLTRLVCRSFEPEVDETRLFTAAMVTPSSGSVQSAISEDGSEAFFERTRELTTLHSADRDAKAMANHYAKVYSEPVKRVPSLVLQPARQLPTFWAEVFALEISDRIQTIEDPPGGAEISREHFIEGVSEQITASDWVVSLQLSPTELEGRYFIVGVSAITQEGNVGPNQDYVIGW